MKRALYAAIILWVVGSGVYLAGMERVHSVSISTAFTDSADERQWCELDTYIEGYGKFGMLSHAGGKGEACKKYCIGTWNNIIVWAGNGI